MFHLLAGVLGTNAEVRQSLLCDSSRSIEAGSGPQEVASLVTSEGNSDPELTAALGPSATWDLLVTDIGPGMKGILVTVHWKQGELAQSVSLGTLAQAGGIASIRNRYAN